MKRIAGVVKLLVICLIPFILTACGDDVYYTMENTDERLCGRTWVETIALDNDPNYISVEHQLVFSQTGQSRETWIKYKNGGGEDSSASTFTWRWMDNSREGLILDYGGGDLKYFDNVWVRDHYLAGKLDGNLIMMKDASYSY